MEPTQISDAQRREEEFDREVEKEFNSLKARADAIARQFNKKPEEVFKKLNLVATPANLRSNAYTSWHAHQKRYFSEGMPRPVPWYCGT